MMHDICQGPYDVVVGHSFWAGALSHCCLHYGLDQNYSNCCVTNTFCCRSISSSKSGCTLLLRGKPAKKIEMISRSQHEQTGQDVDTGRATCLWDSAFELQDTLQLQHVCQPMATHRVAYKAQTASSLRSAMMQLLLNNCMCANMARNNSSQLHVSLIEVA